VIKIDLNELDFIKERDILGIQTEHDSNSETRNSVQKINFFDNMNQYWDNMETQIKHTDFSMKQTDHKVLKMFMIERMLPEYSIICLS